jgi:hypothetical protein
MRRCEAHLHSTAYWAYSSTLKTEAVCSSQKSVDLHQTTRRHIPLIYNFGKSSSDNYVAEVLVSDMKHVTPL